jgi:hypothetical protein
MTVTARDELTPALTEAMAVTGRPALVEVRSSALAV